MADHLAKRVQRDSGEKALDEQVKRSFQLCLGRSPTEDEQKLAQQLVKQHGLEALARVLFNTSEFLIAQ